jgi:hypothetical protein
VIAPPGQDLQTELASALASQEGEATAYVDLSTIFSGSWERVLLSCGGVTASELDDALGFEWEQRSEFDDIAVQYFLILATDTKVTEYWADWDTGYYFTLCGNDSSSSPKAIAILNRADSVIGFARNPVSHSPFWYLDPEDLGSTPDRPTRRA